MQGGRVGRIFQAEDTVCVKVQGYEHSTGVSGTKTEKVVGVEVTKLKSSGFWKHLPNSS